MTTAPSAAASSWRPIKVSVVDVEQVPERIDGTPEYRELWALIREGRRPRGLVRIPFSTGHIGREDLLREITTLPPARGVPISPPGQDEELPTISVVIASRLERPELLHACLRSLAELEHPAHEVIVVDNRGGGPAVELPGVRVVRELRTTLSAARNRGLAEASGEVVAYTDDDVEVDPAWLLALGRRFRAHPDETAVTGLVLPKELETPAQLAFEEYYDGFSTRAYEPVSHRMPMPAGRGGRLCPATVAAVGDGGDVRDRFSLYLGGRLGVGANMAFRAGALRALGGFDLALGPGTIARNGEELAVLAQLVWQGEAVGFEPAALVRHVHRRDFGELERQVENYGAGYAAAMTSLVLTDRRHVARILGSLPRAAGALAQGYRRKRSSPQAPSMTNQLALRELRGMVIGPAAYLRSRRRESR